MCTRDRNFAFNKDDTNSSITETTTVPKLHEPDLLNNCVPSDSAIAECKSTANTSDERGQPSVITVPKFNNAVRKPKTGPVISSCSDYETLVSSNISSAVSSARTAKNVSMSLNATNADEFATRADIVARLNELRAKADEIIAMLVKLETRIANRREAARDVQTERDALSVFMQSQAFLRDVTELERRLAESPRAALLRKSRSFKAESCTKTGTSKKTNIQSGQNHLADKMFSPPQYSVVYGTRPLVQKSTVQRSESMRTSTQSFTKSGFRQFQSHATHARSSDLPQQQPPGPRSNGQSARASSQPMEMPPHTLDSRAFLHRLIDIRREIINTQSFLNRFNVNRVSQHTNNHTDTVK